MQESQSPIDSRLSAYTVVAISVLLPFMGFLLAVPVVTGIIPLGAAAWVVVPYGALVVWAGVRIKDAISLLWAPITINATSGQMQAVTG